MRWDSVRILPAKSLRDSSEGTIDYAFRFGQVEGAWNNIGKDHSVTFLDLKPGTYQLQIRSTNSDGVWVDNVRTLTVIVEPTFWETRWAQLLYVIVFTLLIWGILHTRRYIINLKRHQQELHEAYLALLNAKSTSEKDMKHLEEPTKPKIKPEDELKSQDEIMNSKVAVGALNVVGNDENGEVLKAKEVIATEPVKPKEEENKVFDVVEQMPSYPGGMGALMQYLSSNIKYPVIAEENGIQGRVICTFVVERDGSITDVRIAKSVDPSLDKEAMRVVSSMPKWIPGKQNGSAVRVKYTLPVTFRLQ